MFNLLSKRLKNNLTNCSFNSQCRFRASRRRDAWWGNRVTVGIVAAWLLLVSDFFSLTGLGFGHSLWVQEQQEEGHGCVTKFIQPDLIYFSFLCERVSLFAETMVWSFFFFGLLIACTGELVFFLCYIKLPYCVFMNWSLQLRAHLREKAYAHCLIHISSVRGLYKHAVLLSVTGFVFVSYNRKFQF